MFLKYKNIILVAILIRILIAPFFYHPDIKSQYFHFQFLSKGVFNIYDFLYQNKKTLPNTDTFNYLPLTYYTFGSYNLIAKSILGQQYSNWLNNWGETKNDDPNIIFYMLVLKIPYIILDISTGILLLKIFKNKKIFYFWLFNPISIYLIYILGNFDILPAFLTLLAFHKLQQNKYNLAYLYIGIAIALKIYPLIFIPFFFFYHPKSFTKNLKSFIFCFIPLIISVLPFLLESSFLNSFLGSGLTQKLLENRILNIPLFPVFYSIIFLIYLSSKSKNKFYIAVFQIFLIFIGLVKFHPQWIIWFLPFISIIFVESKIYQKTIIATFFVLIFIYIFLFNDNFLFWGHLLPIDPNFVNLTSPFEIIKLKFHLNPLLIQQKIHLTLFIVGIITSIIYAKEK